MTRRALMLTTVAAVGICTAGGVTLAVAPDHRDRGDRDPAEQLINLDSGTVVVYEDGRVYRRAEMGHRDVPDGFAGVQAMPKVAPPAPSGAYEWATLSDEALDDLVEHIDVLGLLDDELDFGDPMITDSPTSQLTLSIDGEQAHHDVYAPDYSDGLSAEQRANRAAYAELRRMLFDLEDEFGDAISKFAAYVPEEWTVGTGTYVSSDVDRPWPLPDDPVEGDCVELPTDEDVDTATGGYLLGGDIVVADATLPADPRCL